MAYKVGILTTHPIQYQVPWFKELAKKEEIDLTVFYCMIPDAQQQGDGFGVAFKWDIPLLEGYKFKILKNVASSPSVTSFMKASRVMCPAVRTGRSQKKMIFGFAPLRVNRLPSKDIALAS